MLDPTRVLEVTKTGQMVKDDQLNIDDGNTERQKWLLKLSCWRSLTQVDCDMVIMVYE